MLAEAPSGGPKEITFTDTTIENKVVLEHFLELAVNSNLKPGKVLRSGETI